MPENLIVRSSAPTLAGLKTASLFNIPLSDKDHIRKNVSAFNKKYHERGIEMVIMKYMGNRVLLYVFRPSRLKKDFSNQKTRNILIEHGYNPDNYGACIAVLIQKMNSSSEFPHEIGCFLGYPPEDVKGFMEDKDGSLYTGFWKVYADVDTALRTFAKYRKCIRVYMDCYSRGISLDRLVVSQV